MAAVGVIYVARTLISRTAVELYVLAASAVAIWQLTWVHKIFANFVAVEKGGPGSISTYSLYAVTHAHMAVQVTLAVAAVAGVALFFDALRAIRSPHPHLSLLLPR